MASSPAQQELGRTTMSRLRNGVDDWDDYGGRSNQAWLVCNSLAHSAAGGEIEFLTGRVHSQETGEIEIAAFTKDFLIYCCGVTGSMGPTFRIIPRRALTRLEVNSAPEVITNRYMDHYVSGSYSVAYGESLEFTLPLAPRDYDADLVEFAPTLWKDLLA